MTTQSQQHLQAECPTRAELATIFDVSHSSSEALESHLAVCEACRLVLDDMAVQSEWWTPRQELLRDLQHVAPLVRRNMRQHDYAAPTEAITQAQTDEIGKPDDQESQANAHRQLGPWQIIGEIGRGGMGIVYKAHDPRLQRTVALKVLRCADATDDQMHRIRREATTLAQINHPNIVQIFDVGDCNGQPWLALEFVDGVNLAERLDHTPQPALFSAQLVETLARAMAVAHQAEIIHRDIKPANILIVDTPTNAQSAIKITDFGLAKRLDAEEPFTNTGVVAGTPCYMAPEQARSSPTETGPLTDVYSLGAVLYEMLTGRPPFKGESAVQTMHQVVNDEPVSPLSFQRDLPNDLVTICMKCLEKEPSLRYPSALALAEDLQRFQRGEAIYARPPGTVGRILRWAKRAPSWAALVTVSVMAILTIVSGSIAFGWQMHDQRLQVANERDKFKHERERAVHETQKTAKALDQVTIEKRKIERLLEQSRIKTYALNMLLAQREWENNNLAPALKHLEDTRKELRGWEHAYCTALIKRRMPHVLDTGERNPRIAYSPDGTFLAVATSVNEKRQIRIWDFANNKVLHTLSIAAMTNAKIMFSTDGKRLIATSTKRRPAPGMRGRYRYAEQYKVWAVATGKLVCTVDLGEHPARLPHALSADGKVMVSTARDGQVHVWDMRTGTNIRTIPITGNYVQRLALSPKGAHLAITSSLLVGNVRKYRLDIFTMKTGKQHMHIDSPNQSFSLVEFARDDASLIFGVAGTPSKKHMTFYVYDVKSKKQRATFTSQGRFARLNQNGDQLLCWDTTSVSILQMPNGKSVRRLRSRLRITPALCGAGNVIALARENSIHVYDVKNKSKRRTNRFQLLHQFNAHMHTVTAMAFHPDGKQLASADREGVVRIWNIRPADDIAPIQWISVADNGNVSALAVSQNGKSMLLETDERNLSLRDVPTNKELFTAQRPRGAYLPVVSPDGKHFAWHGGGRTIITWDRKQGLRTIKTADTLYGRLAFSADGNLLICARRIGMIQIFEFDTGKEIFRVEPRQTLLPTGFGLSNNCKYLAVGSITPRQTQPKFESVRMWSVKKKQVKRIYTYPRIRNRSATPQRIVFARDDTRFAVTAVPSNPSRAYPWVILILDRATGKPMARWSGSHKRLKRVVFTPDGKRICAVMQPINKSSTCEVVIWDIATGQRVFALPVPYREIGGFGFSDDGERLMIAGKTN